MLNDHEARRWCEQLARGLPSQEIRPGAAPYLTRYFCAGWNPYTKRAGASVFLHHFHASDPNDAVHSHPWAWGASLILVGGYSEYRCEDAGQASVSLFVPGMLNVLRPGDRHRITLLGADCWTLFLAAEYQQPWGFAKDCS